jgi:molybdopterin molybdotransferase
MISIDQALGLVLAEALPLPIETVRLPQALGQALADHVVAGHDIPPFNNSAMDGFAVRAEDIRGAGEDKPAVLRLSEVIPAGHAPRLEVGAGQAAKIMTGAPLPAGADTVVEVEVTGEHSGRVLVYKELRAGSNLRFAGEDVKAGDVVLHAGDVLGSPEIGFLASLGFAQVGVHRRPRVAIISTGSELVEPGEPLSPGKIRNSNGYSLEAQCREAGALPERLGVAPDEYEATRRLMQGGLSHDVLITSGGVSVGEFDFVKDVQEELGVQRRLWQVAMKPGKPLAFGVRDRTLVFGVPGNPVAAMVSFELFVRPALLKLMGHRQVLRPRYRAVIQEQLKNRHGRTQVVRVRAWWQDGRWLATSTGPQGSGILRSMVLANGLVFVPAEAEVVPAGSEVDLLLLRDLLLQPGEGLSGSPAP